MANRTFHLLRRGPFPLVRYHPPGPLGLGASQGGPLEFRPVGRVGLENALSVMGSKGKWAPDARWPWLGAGRVCV